MKKTTRFVAVAVAALMILISAPFAVTAETTVPTGLTKDNLVLSLDNLAQTTTGDVTYIANTLVEGTVIDDSSVITVAADGDKLFVGNGTTSKNNSCQIYGGITNLPLDNTSKYTITFDAAFTSAIRSSDSYNLSDNGYMEIGFAFGTRATAGFTGRYTDFFIIDGRDTFIGTYGATATQFGGCGTKKTSTEAIIPSGESQEFTMIINGGYVTLICEGNTLFSYEIPENYYYDFDDSTDGTQSYLTLGCFVRAGWNADTTNGLASVSNINIYRGVAADTTVVGVQNTFTAGSTATTQSVRFLATINALDVSAVGFEISAKYMDGTKLVTRSWDFAENSVYTSVKAGTPQGTVKDVTAIELGGKYLIVVDVDNVPVSNGQQIDFYVSSYVLVGGNRIYGEQVTASFVGGVANSSVALLTEAVQ